MSLLMDALRRAETQQEQDKPAPAESATEQAQPADEPDMQLEPLNAATQLVEELQTETDAFVVDKNSAADEAADAEPPRERAKTAAALVATPATAWQKKALYFLSGFVTIIVIVGAYYLWRSDRVVIPATPHTATLIDVPAPETNPPPATEPLPAPAVTERTAAAFVPATPVPTSPRQPDAQAAGTADISDAAVAQPAQRIEIHRSRRIRAVHPLIQNAYQAYQQQNYVEAEQLYRKALKRNPDSRDAALGLAGIAMHQGDLRVARYYYERVLKANPADKTAQIALGSLGNSRDSLQETSQLKHWLQSDRDNAQLHFALGNRYASAGQWKEAQQAYFEAQRIDPIQPDYAFNLAISLDQLGLQKQALEYYLKAQGLAADHSALFNTRQLDNRIRELEAGKTP
ncbi:MAG: tetratricopeptide repeat protein [Thiogranum sp.]